MVKSPYFPLALLKDDDKRIWGNGDFNKVEKVKPSFRIRDKYLRGDVKIC